MPGMAGGGKGETPMTGHDYFRALLEVATVINSSLEPTVVLHKITEQTAKAMNCKGKHASPA